MDFLFNIDISIVRFIREFIANPVLDFLMPVITLIGEDGLLWIVLSLILLFFKKTRKAGFVMALSLLLGFLTINVTIKPLFDRVRPYVIDNVPILIKGLGDGSFPSGHTACCFEGAASLLLCGYRKWGKLALLGAVLVAFSRIYLYVHYPSDVIAGAILGVIIAYISLFIVNKTLEKVQKSKTL